MIIGVKICDDTCKTGVFILIAMFCRPDCSARLDFLRHHHRSPYVVHQENTSCPLGRNEQKKEKLMHKLIDPTLPTTKTPPTENVLYQYQDNTSREKNLMLYIKKRKSSAVPKKGKMKIICI